MLRDDEKLLDSFEQVYRLLEQVTKSLTDQKCIYAEKIRQWEDEIKAYGRIIEEISLPARLILEHILLLKFRSGQMAMEAENITQVFSAIGDVRVEKFGIIKITSGDVELSWRDELYNYLIYPDKVELRTNDEKTTIKLFFSQSFEEKDIQKFSDIKESLQLLYIHPSLEKHIH
ncbi:hypothetical protein LPY66_11855 [Dehalobacter sp. DCM]|uniref:hypothetical protein n=1 Tax=Dehalobacter sp. DCM TaxID=2907827 RepID=UPI00308197BF|nr:hypothetical protein LPY66_11855 [Dehalobacter sp. DCM]